MTHTADNTDRQENAAMPRHRAHAIHRHTGFGWRYIATCCCGWRDLMRTYFTRDEAMAAARAHRLAPSSSVGGTTTSGEEQIR